MKQLANGAEISLAVTAVDDEGAGVGAADGVAVHVPGALPGETVRTRIAHVSTHGPRVWGVLRAVDDASPDRVTPACPGHGACGGCVLQHWRPASQLAWKEAALRARVAKEPLLAGVPVARAVASP